MSWIPLLLGALLGLGVMLIFQGLRTLGDKSLDEQGRRKGFWRLNAGLVLIALSVVAFTRVSSG